MATALHSSSIYFDEKTKDLAFESPLVAMRECCGWSFDTAALQPWDEPDREVPIQVFTIPEEICFTPRLRGA